MPKSDLSDEYFNRSHDTVSGTPLEALPVCYGLFCRQPGLLCGVQDVAALLDRRCSGPATVRGKADGEPFGSNEIVMTIEGPFGQLVTLETEYLGMLSLSAA